MINQLNINSKKKGCLIVSKRVRQTCELRIGDVKNKQYRKYLSSVAINNERVDIEIRRRRGIANDAFPKLSKVFKRQKIVDRNEENNAKICNI